MKFYPRHWPILLIALFFGSCLQPDDTFENPPSTSSAAEQSYQIVWEWTEQYLVAERYLPGFRPAPTARALAYIHMGAYETAIPGMPDYRSLSEVIPGFPALKPQYHISQIDWSIALNAYYARVLPFFLYNADQNTRFDIEKLEITQLTKLSQDVPQGIVDISIEWGQQVANHVINYSETDQEGSNQVRVAFPNDYFPPVGDGLWTPTYPDYSRALFPYWGKVRTFAANGSDLVSPPPPNSYNTNPSSKYYTEHVEVADAVKNLTDESRWVAEFWSDDLTGMTFSPPARIFAIANQVIKLEDLNLEETLHAFCKLGIAINDASVAAWNSKYIYNTERPETFIKKYIDPDFKSILGEIIGIPGINPAFPGYPSGHSTFAGVNWIIFDHFFGPNYEFTDHCHFGRTEFNGYPRSYHTWKQMAEENAFSRIPLGVHVRMDCREGLRLGTVIASKALALNLKN